MADEYTPNLGLTKPDVGYSDDTWGEKLNINFDKIDAAISGSITIPPEYITESELPELVDDRVAALLQAGANVTITYDDAGNKITIASSGGGSGGGVSVTMSVDPPASPVAGNLWFESDTGLLYIYYVDPTPNSYWVALTTLSGGGGAPPSDTNPLMNGVAAPGVATLYARGDHVHPSDTSKASTASVAAKADTTYVDTQNALRLLKTANLSDVANVVTSRQNIYAAPFDAMAYNGMQINGSFEVSQELGTTGVTLTGTGGDVKPCDGWHVVATAAGGMNVTAAQLTGNGGQSATGSDLRVNPVAAFTAPTNGDQLYLRQSLEGYRVARLGWGAGAAQQLSYAFWIFCSAATAVIATRIMNSAATRAFYLEHALVGGWNYVTGTIPVGDTTGVWLKTNGVGMYFDILLAGKTASPVAPGSWTSTIAVATTGMNNNAVSIAGQVVALANFIVLPGLEAPSAARSALIVRPYDQELLTCRRYWQSNFIAVDVLGTIASQVATVSINYAPSLRSAPSTLVGTALLSSNCAAPVFTAVAATANYAPATVVGTAVGRFYWMGTVVSDARI